MDQFSAVVYTAGRTGSHLIIKNLQSRYNAEVRLDHETNVTSGIVHTHNPLYDPPNDNFVAIISRRRNLFDSILSMELTKKTNEFSIYTDKEIQPYSIDINKFEDCYYFQKLFYKAIDRTKFSKVVDIYYEDLISSPDSLSEFDIITNLTEGKSPYNHYEIITNINELKGVYHRLEQVEISNEQLEDFKKNVKADLDDIRINHQGNRK